MGIRSTEEQAHLLMKQAFGKFVRKIQRTLQQNEFGQRVAGQSRRMRITEHFETPAADLPRLWQNSILDDWKEVLLQSHGRRETTIRFTLFDYIKELKKHGKNSGFQEKPYLCRSYLRYANVSALQSV